MGIYIMIMYFAMATRSESLTTQEFESKETCEAAKTQIIASLKKAKWASSYTFLECVKK